MKWFSIAAIVLISSIAAASTSVGMRGYWAGAEDGSYAAIYDHPTEGPVVGISDGERGMVCAMVMFDGVPHLQVMDGRSCYHINLVELAKKHQTRRR